MATIWVHAISTEGNMEGMNRRTAMALGMTAAAASVVSLQAKAATYGPEEGEAIAEGVRQVNLSE